MMFLEKVKEQSKELEKVRKRNKQLMKTHDHLQKECEEIANKIIATQVERAESLENAIVLRKELNEEKTSYFEKMNAIEMAEKANESLLHMLQKDNSSTQNSFTEAKYLSEKLGFRKEMEKCLQDELIEYRLKTAENEATIHELRNTVAELEKEIDTIKRITPDTVARIQEELIFAKTRELAIEMEFENIKREVGELRAQCERRRKEKNKGKVSLKKTNSFLRKKSSKWEHAPEPLKSQYEIYSSSLREYTEEKKKLLHEVSNLEKELEVTQKQISFKNEELRMLSELVRKDKLREYKTTKDLLDRRKRYAELEKELNEKLNTINQSISEKRKAITHLIEKANKVQQHDVPEITSDKENEEAVPSPTKETTVIQKVTRHKNGFSQELCKT